MIPNYYGPYSTSNGREPAIDPFWPDNDPKIQKQRARIAAQCGADPELLNPLDDHIGVIRVKRAIDWTTDASRRPNPGQLWKNLWMEGETCCLFADSNLGKSIYAVQIANEIAKTQKVMYFDFELSDKQFQLRYSDDKGQLYEFHRNLLRCEIDPLMLDEGLTIEDVIITDIEISARKHGVKVIIIDNLTFLCNNSESGDSAGSLMTKLINLKRQFNLSILVIAHTPKRQLNQPITQNDLAGSKRLFNFFDSGFAIGKSAKDPALRYIKQLKVRSSEQEYGSDNVIVCELKKEGSWLYFDEIGHSYESDHLKTSNSQENDIRKTQIRELREQGLSMSEIAAKLGISKSYVGKVCKSAS